MKLTNLTVLLASSVSIGSIIEDNRRLSRDMNYELLVDSGILAIKRDLFSIQIVVHSNITLHSTAEIY